MHPLTHLPRPQLPRTRRARLAGALAAAALAVPLLPAAQPVVADDDGTALQRAFAAAAERHHVPQEVLLGVSYLQTRWDGHDGAPSVVGGYGPMHLTDADTALAATTGGHHAEGAEDPRGDHDGEVSSDQGGTPAEATVDAAELAADYQSLDRAAELTGLAAEELRTDDAANVEGGAALLADAQRGLGLPLSADPADWYAAVAGYAGSDTLETARVFADDVYAVIGEGAARTTDSGQQVRLAATAVAPRTEQAGMLGLPSQPSDPRAQCPPTVSCAWIDAAYGEYTRPNGTVTYGNHDKGNRPASQKIKYLVIHNMEGYYQGSINLVQRRDYNASWQYSLRASDGAITQHLPHKDVAWQAGNWYINATSIGLEHEGFLRAPDTWYTEAQYRTSARLVRYLVKLYDIPLDRHHILGHYNVPGVGTANIPNMHTDPGPFWDWDHYFQLLGRPIEQDAGVGSPLVTIRPDYDTHMPSFTACDPANTAAECPAHGSEAVRLHTAPSTDAPLVKDFGTHPGSGTSTRSIYDIGSRVSTGQQYAVADRSGEWTAIWYNGVKAWFHNPASKKTAVPSRGWIATAKPGVARVDVYGVAYPLASDYPPGVAVRAFAPLPYTFLAGQSYAVGGEGKPITGEYYSAVTFDPSKHVVVRGQTYYQIQLGHRIAFVRADQVDVVSAG
ncbi:N-acetylmuramoyl-L-alanine amidase [Streptomyces sp. NPDC051940]|uniref:N-acetylmuramoyl-L-alanine amidase n=1 Tax=Streptomyces sp. NPDC051940 TaxID=3155675 RepID=UPI00341CCEDE